jgi:hypothetical protein
MWKLRLLTALTGGIWLVAIASAGDRHWSFTAPHRPAVPAVKDEAWCSNPIDHFILSRLESEALKPSPEANKVVLLRRLSLDLVGLPPTIDEVNAFLADKSPDAYSKQVERLLASPHYGERWGRHWLDAARYADSDGFEKDKPRLVYFYRDYVINAFNRDLPYDQFIIEQLAGDELPHPTQDQIVATGFLRNSMVNEEGGVDPEQFRMDAMFDRMDCLGKSVLGLTIQCAQCHNHKYDPFTQEDYYRLFAFLNNDNEAQRVVYTPEELQKVADLRREMREVEAGLRHTTPDWEERMKAWEQSLPSDKAKWTVLKTLEPLGDNSQRYIPQPDGSVLAQGYAPTKFTQNFRTQTDVKNVTAFRLELLPDPNLPASGPGRSIYGTCALSEFSVEAAQADSEDKKIKVKFASATSDYDPPAHDLEPVFADKTKTKRTVGPVKFAIDGDANTAWDVNAGPGRRNAARKAVFRCEKPIAISGGAVLTLHLQQNHGGWNSDDNQNNNLGRFRISVTDAEGDVVADPVPKRVRDILSVPMAKRSKAQAAEVFAYWRTQVPEWKEANDKIESLWQQWPAGVTSFTLAARKAGRETAILSRGDWLKPTSAVTPGVPKFLSNPLPDGAPPTRLTLARWLVDPKSPTTARALVNRIWQAYFGVGLINTPEDLGTQGERPSNPELLDWLACEFVDPSIPSASSGRASSGQVNHWSIKHIHRLIVNSATYRQSSRVNPDLYAKDPYNRLLARGPRFRVEGEIVRDLALSVSGLLNEEVGGRSVMPPAPAFLFQPPASYAPFPWIDESGPEKYRRAVYTFRRRSTPYPVLQTFDVPNGESACVRRLRSNSPLQALASLNEPIFVECAQALAKHAITQGGNTDQSRLNYAFRRVLSRTPTEGEVSDLRSLLDKERKRIASGELNSGEIATGTTQPAVDLPADVKPDELAAYTVVSRVLLSLDETITKE